MAITINQQVDYLYKKLGYSITKTDTPSNKSVSNETISSPLLIRGDTIWQQSSSVPSTIPSSNSSVVTVYVDTLHSTIQTTNDATSATSRTWLTGYQDWIPASFGSTYQVKVYVAPTGNASPQTYGTQLFPDGTGIGDEWFFDYQSGVLNFAGNVLPSVSFVGNSVFVSGARYTGTKGVTTIGNINFANNTISSTGSNANLYITTGGNIYVTASGGYINTNNAVITGVASPVNSQDVVTLGFLQTVVGGNANVISQGSSSVRVVGSSSEIDFIVSGNLVANITAGSSRFYNTVNIGNLSFNNGTITSMTSGNISIVPSSTGVFQVIGSSAMGIPFGNTAVRPSNPTIGYVRYNTDIGTIEYWNSTTWAGLNQQITTETVTADGIHTSFTLIYATSTNAAIVSINGTVQQPGTAYTINGNTITFPEILPSSDIIEIRTIGASVSISGMSAPDHSSSLTLLAGNVNIIGNIVSAGYANISGNVSANYFMGNGALLSGMISSYGNANVSAYLVANSIYPYGNINVASYLTVNPQAGLYSNSNVASYLTVNPQAGLYSNANVASYLPTYSGNVNAAYHFGNGSQLTGIGGYSNANVASYLTVNPQAGLYSNANVASYLPTYSGNIASLSVPGSANIIGNIFAGGNYYGTIATAAQPNITTVGTLGALTVTGTGSFGTMNAINVGGTLSTAAQPNVTSVGTLTSLAVSGITNVTNATNATAFNNGALIVAGGLGVAKDVYIQGNLYVANVIAVSNSILTVSDPLLYLSGANPYPYNYDIGIYSHFVGGTGNVYQHTGLVRNDSDATWRLFSNVAEPSGGQVTFDSNTIYDSLITGSHFAGTSAATLGNATVSWGSIYGTNLYGTLQTAAQPNITSVGTVTSGTWSGSFGAVSGANLTSLTAGNLTGTIPTGVLGNSTNYIGTTAITLNRASAAQTLTGISLSTLTIGTGLSGSSYSGNSAVTIATNQDISSTASPTFAGLTVPSITHSGTSGVGDIGASGAAFGTVWATATSAKYADLAENYVSDSSYEAGTVLEFGGEYEVTISDTESDRVAGIVSTNPAYLMNVDLYGDYIVALALQGRVPCKVIGNIKKGDMLTSAGNGYAMKSDNKVFGSIIGKALQDFTGGVGVIEVVVGRL